ncbi:MAG: hypothetical protein IJK23_14535 [Clostridia bacterium]|nr:hypothetical protein [Clostridia bacterium]
MQKSLIRKPLSVLLAVCLLALCMPMAAQAAGNGKALQLVQNGAAANIEGAQASSVYFGNYMQSSPDGKDPVKWRVLSNADGKLFLLSDQNLDMVRYNQEYFSVSWEKCTLRAWLNGYARNPYIDNFIGSAFSGKEAAAVAETALVNDDNPEVNGTTDKVFLLSVAEAKNTAYGFTDDESRTETRVAMNTEYVRAGGHSGYAVGEAGSWWLHSHKSDVSAPVVYGTGFLKSTGIDVNDYDTTVRPAFNLDLNAVLFTSSAADGKISAVAGGGEAASNIFEISDYDDSDWKLTLLDESRAFAVTETAATAVFGGSVTLTYTGATTGDNEYVSVILADADGSAVYYGRLSQPDAADGSVTVILPELATGSYTLKVFSEQYNGDYKTDYASAFSDVALTVLSELDAAKAAAKAELENYFAAIDPADYRPAQQDELTAAVDAGKDAIDAAADIDAVATALAGAKAVIDAIKTDAQLAAEELAADTAAADAVEAKIDAIGEVAYTDESKAKIDEARAAYDALTPAQQALVENADVLTAAEARYAELKEEAETPDKPAKPTAGGKLHGERCVCYDITGDSLFANILRLICAVLCFVWAMQEALGV